MLREISMYTIIMFLYCKILLYTNTVLLSLPFLQSRVVFSHLDLFSVCSPAQYFLLVIIDHLVMIGLYCTIVGQGYQCCSPMYYSVCWVLEFHGHIQRRRKLHYSTESFSYSRWYWCSNQVWPIFIWQQPFFSDYSSWQHEGGVL